MKYSFANCLLDTDSCELLCDDRPVHVEPQVFALLLMLAEARGRVVTKDAMIETVWQGLHVSDATIAARISAARKAVGDDGQAQSVIRTQPKIGFKMMVEVSCDSPVEHKAETPLARPPVRFANSADGKPIAYTCHGQGPPLLRAGHWLSHLELDWDCPVWKPLLSELSRTFTLYRYDPRGTGLSTRGTDALTLEMYAADLLAVADAAGLDRFPIFAASQAVPIAIRFAADHPDRVSRMVLYGGYATGRIYRDTEPGQVEEETVLSLIRAGWGQPDGPFMQAFNTLFMPDATPEQIASFVRIQASSISPDGAAKVRMAVDRFRVEEDLARVQAPTMVLHARHDAIHPMSQGQYLAACMPNAEFVMLDSRNHAPLPQDPAWRIMVDTIQRFCAEG